MALYILGASILLQLAAVVIASMIAWTTLRRSWILIAAAITLMAVRRTISLYQAIMVGRNIDAVAESVALLISLLMLLGFSGLFLRERSIVAAKKVATAKSGPARKGAASVRPGAVAAFLGILTVLTTSVIAYLSFTSSRDALIETLFEANQRAVQSLSMVADLPNPSLSFEERLQLIDDFWATSGKRFADSYVCVVNSDGELLTHTGNRSMEGRYVGDNPIRDRENRVSDIAGLLDAKMNWTGWYEAANGEEQIAAFSYSESLSSLVALHVPRRAVEREILLGTLPLTIGLVFVMAVLLPAALGVLYRAYSTSLQKVESSEAQYRAVVEDQTELICRNLPDGTITFVNEAYCRYFGKSLDDLVGNKFLPLIPEDDHSKVREHFASLGPENPIASHEHRVILPDGEVRWMKWTNRAILDDEGNVIEIQGTGRDITERKEAEKALRESEDKFRVLTVSSPIGIFLVDPRGMPIYANEKCSELTGMSEEELLSDNWSAGVHPDDREMMIAEFVNATKKRVEAHVENRWVHADGQVIWTSTGVAPVRGSDGKVSCFTGTFTDITERKQAEEKLRASEQHLIEAQTIAQLGSWDWDFVSRKVVWSDTMYDIFGQDRETFAPDSDSIGTLVHPDDLEAVNAKFRAALKDKTKYEPEMRIIRPDGTVRTIQTRGIISRAADGNPVRVTMTVQDITEQKRARAHEAELEQQLLQAQKLESLGTLAGGIAHDFNNILQSMLGFASLAQEMAEGNDELSDCLGEIETGGRRAADLVSQMLTFSRKSEPEIERVDLQPLIEEALKFIRSSMPATIRIESEIDAGCGPILANANQIHQVVTNLCTNAMHAMEENGGVLKVSLEPISVESSVETLSGPLEQGEYMQLSVSDTGTGIDPALFRQILDPFFTTKEIGKGTGLGLAMVHGIVTSSRGGLSIESELGIGTTVRVMLPVARESGTPEEPQEAPKSALKGSGRVMLVDDEEAITKLTKLALESSGFTVEAFNDVADALEAATAHPGNFDVAVLDYTMPGKTGLELAKDFESLLPDMSVILATGLMDNSKIEKLMPSNVVEVLKKPYKTAALIAALNRTL